MQLLYTDHKVIRSSVTRAYSSVEDVLKTFLQDVLKTSWKRLEDVLKTYSQDECIGLSKTSWRRLEEVFWRSKAKGNILVLIKTSSSRRMFAGISYFKHYLKSFFSFVTLRNWMILNMPLERLCELKTVVAWLKIVHLKTQQLVVIKQAVFFTMYFSFLIHDF